MKVGRNDPCPCGSDRKYKHCCALKAEKQTAALGKGWTVGLGLLVALAVGGTLALWIPASRDDATNRIWSVEHGHWHDATTGQELSTGPSPPPPGAAPPGKVWSTEHGHWHDIEIPAGAIPGPG